MRVFQILTLSWLWSCFFAISRSLDLSCAHSCDSRYRLSPSLNLFASTYHEFEDNNSAAFYLRYVHNLRVCSYLARSFCGIPTRLLYVVCTYLFVRFFCPAGISEGLLCFYLPCEYPCCLCLHPRFSCGTCGAKYS